VRGVESISVVVPTHNRPDLLRQTLKAIQRQESVALEIVVVDDGSSSPTAAREAVTELAGAPVVLLRNDVPEGLSAARNRGVAASTGAWVAFCDDDDLWAPRKVSAQLVAAAEAGCGWVYTGAVNITLTGQVIGGAPPLSPAEAVRQLPRQNVVPGGGSGVIVRRSLLDRAGLFDTRLSACEDWDMWIRLSQLNPPACVPRPWVGYRVHPGAMSLDVRAVMRAIEEIGRRYGGPLDRETLYRHMARVALRGGHHRAAVRWYTRAAIHSPSYRQEGFARDVRNVLRARRGARPVAETAPADEASVLAYRGEAQAWVDELS
jgi:glycosyltransferase involved in cell wall biosynthesis